MGWKSATGLAALTAAAALSASAQGVEHEMRGSGVLTTGRGPVAVTSVIYSSREEPLRNSFSATTAAGTVTFSGAEAAWPDKTHATLAVDTVMTLARDGVKDEAAGGSCEFEVTADATFVKALACRATTAGGSYGLRFDSAR